MCDLDEDAMNDGSGAAAVALHVYPQMCIIL